MSRPPDDPSDRRRFLRIVVQSAGGFFFAGCLADAEDGGPPAPPGGTAYDWNKFYWAYAVDTDRCIGCGSCMRACRTENLVPEGFYRTWVERYEIDADDKAHVDIALGRSASFDRDALPPAAGRRKAFFVPKLCNHCKNSVCSQVCPVGASYQTKDGVVLVDEQHCVGCAYCVQACPYATRFINPHKHVADKCTFCYHRITVGLPPACVLVCPTKARMYGNLKDRKDELQAILHRRRYMLLKPELGTNPKCYYLGLDLEVV
ncbi:MAG: 4Fe-4S dicluster domain-containing protein [Deltaproteobacteria bacterium]|nr:4Fe-4S dicluster domain-containing protein [Deltaproteobacteria bacterium]